MQTQHILLRVMIPSNIGHPDLANATTDVSPKDRNLGNHSIMDLMPWCLTDLVSFKLVRRLVVEIDAMGIDYIDSIDIVDEMKMADIWVETGMKRDMERERGGMGAKIMDIPNEDPTDLIS